VHVGAVTKRIVPIWLPGVFFAILLFVCACVPDPKFGAGYTQGGSRPRRDAEKMITAPTASTPAPGEFDRHIEPVDPATFRKPAPDE
jgi:hypothetical protein